MMIPATEFQILSPSENYPISQPVMGVAWKSDVENAILNWSTYQYSCDLMCVFWCYFGVSIICLEPWKSCKPQDERWCSSSNVVVWCHANNLYSCRKIDFSILLSVTMDLHECVGILAIISLSFMRCHSRCLCRMWNPSFLYHQDPL